MDEIYILDACAVIALLRDEKGADTVEKVLIRAESGSAKVYMNIINIMEVYYDFYRSDGESFANEQLLRLQNSVIIIDSYVTNDLLKEAGRIKALY